MIREVDIDYTDKRKCVDCIRAKYKEKSQMGRDLFFCGLHRQYITDDTFVFMQPGCLGKDFEKRNKK